MAALVASVSNRLRLANNIYNIEALSHSFRSKYLELSYVFLRWVQQPVLDIRAEHGHEPSRSLKFFNHGGVSYY